jgi:tyrosine-protein kinase Etk/Wzc
VQSAISEEQYRSNKSELWNLGIKDIFFKYIRFLPVFILSLSLALFGAYLYLRYATPIYRSSGTMLIKNPNQGGSATDAKLNQLFGNNGTDNIQNEIEVLRSRPLMQRVVDSMQLQVSYYAVGKIKSPNIYKQGPFLLEIFELSDSNQSFSLSVRFQNDKQFSINGEGRFGFNQLFKNPHGVFRLLKNPFTPVGKEYLITYQPSFVVASEYAAGIQVSPKPGTGILIIGLETANPELSADIINGLMVKYGDYTREDKTTEANQTLNFINIRLNKIGHEIDSIQKVLLDFKVRNNLIVPGAQTQSYFQNMTLADQGLTENNMKLNIVAMVDEYLRDKKNYFVTVPVVSSLGIADPTLNSLVISYNSVQIERKKLLESNIPSTNPLVRQTEALIEKFRLDILESLKNVKSSIELANNTLRGRGTSAESQIKALPAKEQELAQIQAQLDSKLGLAKYLMEKKEETSISMASVIANSKVVESAYPSNAPVKPNRRSIQLLAMLIGVAIPAIFIFMMEVVNDKITTRFDIEKITQAAVLGEVGHSYSDSTLVVSKTNRGMVAEQFRIVRSNLQYVLNKIEHPVILVTSSFSGEGKSFITTNLGAVMALAGKKTIILEFDIRKPKIMTGLGMTKRPGITNYLLGKSELKDLPVLVPGYENLYVLACGPVPPNPSELLLDKKVDELFEYLKANFDMIVVDTAPVGMVSDAMTLGKFANCTLYIVRQGHTFKKQVALIDEFYTEGKLPRVSIVINDVKIKPGYGYYGYGRYGYGYGYNSGYYEEEHPPQPMIDRILDVFNFGKWRRKVRKMMKTK